MNEAELEFFSTGVKSYLAVVDAIAEFRRYVQDRCARVVEPRLPDLNRVCGMHWTKAQMKDYLWAHW